MKRVIKDGMVAKKRIQDDHYELYEGRHEAIITQEQWDMVKAAQHILESYPISSTVEKNRRCRLVVQHFQQKQSLHLDFYPPLMV